MKKPNANRRSLHCVLTSMAALGLMMFIRYGGIQLPNATSNTSMLSATIKHDTSPVLNNSCLLQVANVRDLKLYSQNDEDGALLQTLNCMGGHGTKEYFEFGSETGVEVNTRILRQLYGWHGHLLDGGNENPAIPLHREWFTPSNIASLLEKYQVNEALDVLSIDCDWDDFYVMREILVTGYKPRILVVEYNVNLGPEWAVSVPAKPLGKEAEVRWRGNCFFGASATALIMLAQEFGYTPVWANTVNVIFVPLDQATKLGMIIPSPQSFPGPWTRALHAECSGMTWKRIDSIQVAKATNTSLSHEDFASGFSDVKLDMKTFQNGGAKDWRKFYEVGGK